MIYFIADTHFQHKNIIKYCGRPFKNVNQMDNTMINNWNMTVNNNDEIYILGDLSIENVNINNLQNIVSQLKGHKYLLRGNHDDLSDECYHHMGIEKIYDKSIILNDFIILKHYPPYYINNNTPYFYIFGHVHNSEHIKSMTKHSFCVSVERINYTPISIEEIKKKIDNIN